MGDVHDGEFLIRCGLTNVGNKWKLTAARYNLADVEVSTTIGIASTIELRAQYNNGTLTLSYRQTGAGSWTTITSEAYTISPGYLTFASGKPASGHADETFTVYSAVVEEYAAPSLVNHFAFIPTIDFDVYKANYVYVKKFREDGTWDGTFRKIEPYASMTCRCTTDGLDYKWNGTAWVIDTHVLATDTALGPTHTMTGGVLGALLRSSDATHANFQRITINQPNDLNGVAGAVTDNFFSADANDLPKDSGASVASLTLLVTTLQSYILALLSSLNLGSIPGSVTPEVFAQATKPTVNQCPSGKEVVWIDTDDSNAVYKCYNYNGTVNAVEYTP
jgi:hypothetical protein